MPWPTANGQRHLDCPVLVQRTAGEAGAGEASERFQCEVSAACALATMRQVRPQPQTAGIGHPAHNQKTPNPECEHTASMASTVSSRPSATLIYEVIGLVVGQGQAAVEAVERDDCGECEPLDEPADGLVH
jgi:hypothetical protein